MENLTITVEGEDFDLTINRKAMAAIAKLLKTPKISDLEKLLLSVGYDNDVAITQAILKSMGKTVSKEVLEEAITLPNYPMLLTQLIGTAVAGPGTATAEAVDTGN